MCVKCNGDFVNFVEFENRLEFWLIFDKKKKKTRELLSIEIYSGWILKWLHNKFNLFFCFFIFIKFLIVKHLTWLNLSRHALVEWWATSFHECHHTESCKFPNSLHISFCDEMIFCIFHSFFVFCFFFLSICKIVQSII